MKKILSLFVVTFALVLTVGAVRPQKRAFTIKQSDGTSITVYRHGDGHTGVVFYTTLDGIALVQNSKGDLCYAQPADGRLRATELIAHNDGQRSSAEQAFIQQNPLNAKQASRVVAKRSRSVNRIAPGQNGDGLGKYGTTAGGAVPSIGNVSIPVLMVEFSDVKFMNTTTQEVLQNLYNKEGYTDNNGSVGSARDYFSYSSNGMFTPDFQVVGKVTLTKTRQHYGHDDSEDDIDPNVEAFVQDAVKKGIDDGIDFGAFDKGAGIPCIVIIYAGEGEANSFASNSSDFLWPCEFEYNQYYGPLRYSGKTLTINSFFVGNESQKDYAQEGAEGTNERLEGIGTFCHEFGHALGLPDFYCTDYSHETDPMGAWDIMDRGCYWADGYAPIGHTAYEKSFLGWLNIRELTGPQKVTLVPHGSAEGDQAVLVRNSRNSNEYYIFENRKPGKFYPTNYGSGMLAIHVDYNKSKWTDNSLNNDENHLRMQVLPADGSLTDGRVLYYPSRYDLTSDLFPGSAKVTQLTSKMTAFTGGNMDKPLYKIAMDGSNVTFNFMEEEISGLQVGDKLDTLGITYEVTATKELTVTQKAEGKYAGNIVIPAVVNVEHVDFKVVGIDGVAFNNCPELESVTVGKNVIAITPAAFRHSTALNTIEVNAENTMFESRGGMLLTKEPNRSETAERQVAFDFVGNSLNLPVSTSGSDYTGNVVEPINIKDVSITIDAQGTKARMYESNGAIALRIYKNSTLTIAATSKIVKIEFNTGNAFGLTTTTGTLSGKTWTGEAQSISFSNSETTLIKTITVTLIGGSTEQWTLIKAPAATSGKFTVPVGVDIIGDYALEDAAYNSLQLTDSVKTIGTCALSLPHLSELTVIRAVPASCTGNSFEQVDKTSCTLRIPAGSESAFKQALEWKDFLNVTTGIEQATRQNIQKQGTVFDLQGRRVEHIKKGIYIIDGKKVIR